MYMIRYYWITLLRTLTMRAQPNEVGQRNLLEAIGMALFHPTSPGYILKK
jgi:hypothetical protein